MNRNKEQGNAVIAVIFIVIILGIIAFISSKKEERTSTQVAEEISQMSNRYYYNQLNKGYKKYGKEIYKNLYENKEKLKSGNYEILLGDIFSDELEKNHDEGEKYVATSIFAAKLALDKENPELFFLDLNKINCDIIKSDKYRAVLSAKENENYYVEGISSKEDVERMEQEIENATSPIMSELKKLNNDYDKIKKVHDYLIETIEYTDNIENAHNIYGALVNKKCVCEGYSKAFQYFMNKLNIESIDVSGTAHGAIIGINPDHHAWNYVKVNNEWYAIDTTWDDHEGMEYEYFLKGKNKMEETHNVITKLSDNIQINGIDSLVNKVDKEEEFVYPTLSEMDYEK